MAGVPVKKQPVPRQTVNHVMPPVIAKAILEIQRELKPIIQAAKNTEYGSSYSPLDVIAPMAQGLLNKHNIAVVQSPVTDEHGSPALETLFVHSTGKSFARTTRLILGKADPQGHKGAITYLSRTALMRMLGIVDVGEDDDGNEASGIQAPPTEAQIRELKMSMVLLSYSQSDLAKVINAIQTQAAAAVAVVKYRKLVAKKQKQLEVEPDDDDGGPIEQDAPVETEPKEVSPTSHEGFTRRIKALGLAGAEYERKVIVAATKAFSLDKVMEKQERIDNLDAFLKQLESGVHALEPEFYAPTDEPRTVEVNVA